MVLTAVRNGVTPIDRCGRGLLDQRLPGLACCSATERENRAEHVPNSVQNAKRAFQLWEPVETPGTYTSYCNRSL